MNEKSKEKKFFSFPNTYLHNSHKVLAERADSQWEKNTISMHLYTMIFFSFQLYSCKHFFVLTFSLFLSHHFVFFYRLSSAHSKRVLFPCQHAFLFNITHKILVGPILRKNILFLHPNSETRDCSDRLNPEVKKECPIPILWVYSRIPIFSTIYTYTIMFVKCFHHFVWQLNSDAFDKKIGKRMCRRKYIFFFIFVHCCRSVGLFSCVFLGFHFKSTVLNKYFSQQIRVCLDISGHFGCGSATLNVEAKLRANWDWKWWDIFLLTEIEIVSFSLRRFFYPIHKKDEFI